MRTVQPSKGPFTVGCASGRATDFIDDETSSPSARDFMHADASDRCHRAPATTNLEQLRIPRFS